MAHSISKIFNHSLLKLTPIRLNKHKYTFPSSLSLYCSFILFLSIFYSLSFSHVYIRKYIRARLFPRIAPSFILTFPILSALIRASSKDDAPSSSLRLGGHRHSDVRKARASFSSFSFRTGTPREWCMPRRETGLDLHAGAFFLFLFALRFESRAPSPYPHPGSRNCFLSSYPVVLRAPSVPYAPLIEFFRYSPVRYTCCQ